MPKQHPKYFMKIIRGQQGIALVTSLMLTLISMGIILSLMYLISTTVQRSGASKRYKTALEASYGGTELIAKDLFPLVLKNTNDPQLINTLQSMYAGVSLSVATTQQCLQAKLSTQTDGWPTGCDKTLNPKSLPDLTLSLQGTNNQPFTVYSKIVDTVGGNTDMSGLQLEGAGVAEGQNVLTPQHLPYVYRLEVQAERSGNAVEKSNISVLYAY